MKKLLATAFGVMLSAGVYAGNGWSQKAKIAEVYNHGYTVMVRMEGTFVSHTEGACSGASYYALEASDTKSFDIKFSQILMAYAAGKPTQFWINGDSCGGQGKIYQTIGTVRTY